MENPNIPSKSCRSAESDTWLAASTAARSGSTKTRNAVQAIADWARASRGREEEKAQLSQDPEQAEEEDDEDSHMICNLANPVPREKLPRKFVSDVRYSIKYVHERSTIFSDNSVSRNPRMEKFVMHSLTVRQE